MKQLSRAVRSGVLGLLCIAAGPSTPAQAEEPAAAGRDAVEAFLCDARSKEAVDHAVGGVPYMCATGPRGEQICTWQLSKRNVGWKSLAPTIPTSSRINLVCGFEADGQRLRGGCSVRPRNSRESEWYVAPRQGKGSRAKLERRKKRQDALERSEAALATALTVGAVSRLVGQGPDRCTASSDGYYSCLWRASRSTYGHALLAVQIDTDKKVHLNCRFPWDGGDRAPDSCYVSIGS